ncbi:hypothetical protein PPL_10757 [Heterostelium album PN500]|uniref:ComC supersandwich domain-containing protein n=1 Tax=Heterostelium pallidum (strain ATCC 26659 / Pp 5 / PN500) TaxID=670386 RepID=D3BSD1_HETP5|nr:hypothetical protein PPL_10757 [Heterostelium album PN500]EFA75704.1 hypothetical protein PPL_10757 [Heterostelium album PN500]|eukprot:XP_020427838.1 hypothetical protein PPL_10757 [Heterostelium album PN500]
MQQSKHRILNIVFLIFAALACISQAQNSEWDAITMIGTEFAIVFGSSPNCNHPALKCENGNVVGIYIDASTPSTTSTSTSTTLAPATSITAIPTLGTSITAQPAGGASISPISPITANPALTSGPATTMPFTTMPATTIPATTIPATTSPTITTTTPITTSGSTVSTTGSTTFTSANPITANPTSANPTTSTTANPTTANPTSTPPTLSGLTTSGGPITSGTAGTTSMPSTSTGFTGTTDTTSTTSTTATTDTYTSINIGTVPSPVPLTTSPIVTNTSVVPDTVSMSEQKIWSPNPRGRRIYSTTLFNNNLVATNLRSLVIIGRQSTNPSSLILNKFSAPNLQNITLDLVAGLSPILTANISDAFPSLENLEITGDAIGDILPASFFEHPKLKNVVLRGSGIKYDNIFGSTSFNNIIQTFVMEVPSIYGTFVTMTSNSLPVLKNLVVYYTDTVYNAQFNFMQLQTISLIGSNQRPSITIGGCIFTNLQTFYLENSTVLVAPNLLKDYAVYIKSIVIKNTNYQSQSTLFYPLTIPTLELYQEEGTSLQNLPDPAYFQTLPKLVLRNLQSLSTGISNAKYSSIKYFDASNNPSLTSSGGSIPSELCGVNSLSLVNTQVNQVDGCFACYKEYTASWFNANAQFNNAGSGACGNITNQPANGFAIANGGKIDIIGTSLGWGVNASPGVSVISPNTHLTYQTLAETTIPESAITKIINLGSNVQVSVVYKVMTPVIKLVQFTQKDNGIEITISGINFDLNTSFKVNNVDCVGTMGGSNAFYICTAAALPQGKVQLIANSTTYGASNYETSFTQSYPIVTSVSPIGEGDGAVTIYGNFGSYPAPTGPPIVMASRYLMSTTVTNQRNITVLVGGAPCSNITLNEFNLTCSFTPSGSGLKKLTVIIDQYTFESSSILYVTPNTAAVCPDGCGSGTCNNGICSCPAGFNGPSCNFKLPSSEDPKPTIQTSESEPASTYELLGVQYKFNMVSIQEIDSAEAVVSETLLSGWTSTSASNAQADSTTYKSVVLSANITTVIEINKADRQIEFAGINSTYQPNSLKASVTIDGWAFQNSLNYLKVVFATQVSADDSQTCDTSSSSSKSGTDSLKYLSIERNGIIFYGRFLDRSLSDGRPAYSATGILNTTEVGDSSMTYISVSVPQCTNCILDPDFSMLINPDKPTNGCGGDNKRSWVIPVAVVVPVVVISVGVAVAVVLIKKKLYVSRDGLRFRFSRRGQSSRNLAMHHLLIPLWINIKTLISIVEI